jgi:aminotransferase
MINIFQPCLGGEELAALKEVFASNWIGKGTATLEFEKAFAASIKAGPRLFTSVTCCTEGLFLATELFGVVPGTRSATSRFSEAFSSSSCLSRRSSLTPRPAYIFFHRKYVYPATPSWLFLAAPSSRYGDGFL